MATLDINQLIQESVTSSMGDTSADNKDVNEAFLESIVNEIKKSEDEVTLPVLQEAFAEVFENNENAEILKTKLTENEIFIEGFNKPIEESEVSEENPLSTAIGLIASGVAVKKYLGSR